MITATILTPEQLTGRDRSHVVDLTEPPCVLHPTTARAFLALRSSAARHGIDLLPVSSFRGFERQMHIWNAKFRGDRPLLDADSSPLDAAKLSPAQRVAAILQWSALPGASRHHWGTDLDVIDAAQLPTGQPVVLEPAEFAAGGRFEALGRWLPAHAAAHGFFLPYDAARGGVQPEPWHISYAPLAVPAQHALTVQVLGEALVGAGIEGADLVHDQLAPLHERFVTRVAEPPALALAHSVDVPGTVRPNQTSLK